MRRPGFDPWVRKIPWRRKWQPTPELLPRKSHGQRSLVSMGLQRVRHDWATSLFCVFQPPLLNIFCSVRSIPILSFIEPIFAWNIPLVSNFLEEISSLSHSIVFLYFLCIDHWGRLSYLSLLFLGTVHSNVCIFPFLLCLSRLFFSQLFIRPPQTITLPFCIFFLWDDFGHHVPYNVMNLHPQFFRHSVRSTPLSLFITSTVQS